MSVKITLAALAKMGNKQDLLDIAKQRFPELEIPATATRQEIEVMIYSEQLVQDRLEQVMKTVKAGEAPAMPQFTEKPFHELSVAEKRAKSIWESKELMRVIVVDNNPFQSVEDANNMIEWIAFGNNVTGVIKWKVLFDKPWHIPVMLYNKLKSITYVPFDQDGNDVAQVREPTNRYNIKRLPSLTKAERDDILKRQLATGDM